MNYESAYKLLEEKGQLHLLRYYDELKSDEQQALLSQIDQIDFSLIDMIGKNNSGNDSDIAPVAALQLDAINANHDTYLNAGIDTIKKWRSCTRTFSWWSGNPSWILRAKGNLQCGRNKRYVHLPTAH